MDLQISCIENEPEHGPHLRIRMVGGLNADGTRWKVSVAEAIAGIEEGRWRFYVSEGGEKAWVEIATHEGHKYLKTEADSYSPDNLLSLDDCPA